MPKSKVRKKPGSSGPNPAGPAGSRTPVRVRAASPSSPVYIGVMLGFMLLGLAWLVLNYLASDTIGFMGAMGGWNFLIGFGLIVVGLLMTMRWR